MADRRCPRGTGSWPLHSCAPALHINAPSNHVHALPCAAILLMTMALAVAMVACQGAVGQARTEAGEAGWSQPPHRQPRGHRQMCPFKRLRLTYRPRGRHDTILTIPTLKAGDSLDLSAKSSDANPYVDRGENRHDSNCHS